MDNRKSYDLVIIGGGPAGLAAAISAKKNGIDRILILERDKELGGILNQCIHNGFGLHTFKEELTGPEYADRYIQKVLEMGIEYKLNTMVLELETEEKAAQADVEDLNNWSEAEDRGTQEVEDRGTQAVGDTVSWKLVTAMNKEDGLFHIRTKSIILAMGCRERPRGALNIPGYRPAGIFSAGTAQRLVNMEGYLPGREVVILGSGDIGLIMARRMTLEGAKVKVVAEIMPYSGGLKRNIVQCLDDYGIPLKLNHTVVEIFGKERVEGVTIAQVDEKGKPIPGTEEYYSCDTMLLSVGLIPENELSKGLGVEMNPVTSGPRVNESLETNLEGVFACGNVLHVHDLVDFVSEEAEAAGWNAARYVKGMTTEEAAGEIAEKSETEMNADDMLIAAERNQKSVIFLKAGNGIRYTVPETIHIERMEEILPLRFRVNNVYKNCYISLYFDEERVLHRKHMIVAPGEMETLQLKKEQLLQYPDLQTITVKLEEG